MLTAVSPATDVFDYILNVYAPTRDDRDDREAARILRRQWAGVLDEIRSHIPRPGSLLLYTVLRHDNVFEFAEPVRALLTHLHELFPAEALIGAELDILPMTEDTRLGPHALNTLASVPIQKLIDTTMQRFMKNMAELALFNEDWDIEPFFGRLNELFKAVEIMENAPPRKVETPLTVGRLTKAQNTLDKYKTLRKRIRIFHSLNLIYTRVVHYIDKRLGLEDTNE